MEPSGKKKREKTRKPFIAAFGCPLGKKKGFHSGSYATFTGAAGNFAVSGGFWKIVMLTNHDNQNQSKS